MRFISERTVAIGAIGLIALSLAGCNEEIDARQTQEIQGLLYKVHADDPFTGRVTNYPISVLGVMTVGSCVVDFKKGLPDGEMKCSDNTGAVVGTGEFKGGKQDGRTERFDPKSGKKTLVQHWKNGLQDGDLEQFNPQTGDKILEVGYSAGRKDGTERAWDSAGKEKIADMEWKNGLQSGFDNRGAQHRVYLNGKKQGLQQDYSISGNRYYLASESNYDNDVLDGTQKEMNAQGNVVDLSVFDHDKLKSRTVDKYNYNGQHIHHYSGVAVKADVNRYDADDLSKDGVEQYWDDKGHLIRELQWSRGKLQSAVGTVWVGDRQESQFRGLGIDNYQPTQRVVKQGQERIFSDKGELQAAIFWEVGTETQVLSILPPKARGQHPGKMAVVGDVSGFYRSVTAIPDFEVQSSFSGDSNTYNSQIFADIPSANGVAPVGSGQANQPEAAVAIPSSTGGSDGCVQQKVDAVHAEDSDGLVTADMLDEFEQGCN